MKERIKMSEEYKNMDYYQLYEYIEGLRIELEEAQASTEFQGKRADDLRKQLEIAVEAMKDDAKTFEALDRLRVEGAIVLSRAGLKRISNALAEIEKVSNATESN